MKKQNYFNLLFIFLILASSFLVANAQVVRNPRNQPNEFIDQPPPPQNRAGLLQDLGLSREQLQQIRRINVERRSFNQESRKRLDDANFALDEAVYSDNLDENEIQLRLKAVQTAQAEVLKNRIIQETAIRKVLTPAQLIRFRQLREEFDMQKRQNMQQQRNGNPPPNQNPNLKNLPRRRILKNSPNI